MHHEQAMVRVLVRIQSLLNDSVHAKELALKVWPFNSYVSIRVVGLILILVDEYINHLSYAIT